MYPVAPDESRLPFFSKFQVWTDFVERKKKEKKTEKTNWTKTVDKPRKKCVSLDVAIETLEPMNMNEYEPVDIESVYFVFW